MVPKIHEDKMGGTCCLHERDRPSHRLEGNIIIELQVIVYGLDLPGL